ALPFDAADDLRNPPRHAAAMALRARKALVLGHLDPHAGNTGAGEGIGVGPAPELAVGDGVEADLLLQRDHLPDRLVLDRAQPGTVDHSLRVLLARAQQRRRADQAADMLGSKRRTGRRAHGTSSDDRAHALPQTAWRWAERSHCVYRRFPGNCRSI